MLTEDREVIRAFAAPMLPDAGFLNLTGNLFDSAIMKTSVISASFRARYLSDPADPDAFEGRAVVFDGREDYHARINDPSLGIDAHTLLVIRGVGPIGYPGAAEVVNMQPPDALLVAGIDELPCIGDGRQSGTSGSPSILNASPEAAVGGGLALLRTGDRVRIDLREADRGHAHARRGARRPTGRARRRPWRTGGLPYVPASQTPWQEIQRGMVGPAGPGHGAQAGGQVPGHRPRPGLGAARQPLRELAGGAETRADRWRAELAPASVPVGWVSSTRHVSLGLL